MHQKSSVGNRTVAIFFAGFLMAATGGWLALNSFSLNEYTNAPSLAMAGVALLVMSWRLSARTRLSAWALLFAWHVGAGTSIPSGWSAFFNDQWGYVAWFAWAAFISLPALLIPARFTQYGLFVGATLAAITPFGMLNPLGAAIAFWPEGGVAGLLLAPGILLLPSIKHEKKFAMAGIAICFFGILQNIWFDMKKPSPPDWAHSMQTHEGWHPKLALEWFGRQARSADAARNDIEAGVKLLVTPEATVDKWDQWSEAVWRHAKAAATDKNSMVLLGVYREMPEGWKNGLLDLATGEFYGASVSLPLTMWHPWNNKEHFPLDLAQLPRTIKTPVGEAAYLVCFEEVLVWPLAAKAIFGNPSLLISSANQWFTDESATAEAQKRSIELQARLWRLPLLRAVNWPAS